jgi:hypothetical protein
MVPCYPLAVPKHADPPAMLKIARYRTGLSAAGRVT